MIPVTAHAVMRYIERVERVSEDQAIVALSSPAIEIAARFGAPYVRLGTGQRIVIDDGKVVTVLPATHRPGAMSFRGDVRRRSLKEGEL